MWPPACRLAGSGARSVRHRRQCASGLHHQGGRPVFLRTLLILGARSVLASANHKTDRLSRWALSVQQRRGYGKALVAIAAKNARMAWALLAKGEAFAPLP